MSEKHPPRENLVRAQPASFEVRAAEDDGGMPMLVGHFARFNEWTEIDSMFEGRFMERIAPGAFKKTMTENRDHMRILFQHGRDPQIGDKPLAPIDVLREDDQGGYYEGRLLDTSYNADLIPGLRAGQYGASFRFSVMREEIVDEPAVSDHNPNGLPERTIKEARLMEFGPVTFPAYAGATAGVRSLTDEVVYGDAALEAPGRLAKVIEYARDSSAGTSVAAPMPVTTTWTLSTNPNTTSSANLHITPAAPAAASTPAPATSTPAPERAVPADRKEEDVAVDIDRFASLDLLAARAAEVQERQKYLNAEYAGRAYPDEVQNEWDELIEEAKALEARMAHLREREAVIAATPKAQPPMAQPAVAERFNTPRNPIENPYDLHSYRQAASSPEHEARLLRDGVKRSIEVSEFPHPKVTRTAAQEAVTGTVEKLDRQGELAAYLLSTASPTYRRAFGRWCSSLGQVPLDPEEARAIMQARQYEERAFTLGSTGLPVPYQLDPTVIPISNWSVNPFRAISRVEQTVVNEWRGATSAGITAAYAAEGTEASDNTPTLAQPAITAQRAQAFVPFSIEVSQDWSVIEAEMAREIADAKDDLEATKFTLGSGTNEPFGLITGATTLVNTTTTAAFVIADLYKMEEALPPRFRPRASIVGNRFVFNKVRQFDTSGGSGVWLDGLQPGLANQVPNPGNLGPSILGYAAYEDSAMDSVLTTGSEILVMGDFRYFLIVDRVGMSIDLIPHLVSTNHRPTGQRGLYAFWRNGSKVINAAAFRTLQT